MWVDSFSNVRLYSHQEKVLEHAKIWRMGKKGQIHVYSGWAWTINRTWHQKKTRREMLNLCAIEAFLLSATEAESSKLIQIAFSGFEVFLLYNLSRLAHKLRRFKWKFYRNLSRNLRFRLHCFHFKLSRRHKWKTFPPILLRLKSLRWCANKSFQFRDSISANYANYFLILISYFLANTNVSYVNSGESRN